jgi:hypothetical protein
VAPLRGTIVIDVYCLVPYRPPPLLEAAPAGEEAPRNVELVFAFKNGRAMRKRDGGRHPFAELLDRTVRACETSPLGAAASQTTWVPVPRSGASKKSFDPAGDQFPCWTLANALAKRVDGAASNLLTRPSPSRKKREVQANINSLRFSGPLPSTSRIVLLDDVYVTGCALVSCAAVLREKGYVGDIAAFCVGYDVAEDAAKKLHELKQWWRLSWRPGWERPKREPMGAWG